MPNILNRRQAILSLLACIFFCLCAAAAKADTTFVTPPGSSLGGNPVSASATFSQSGNILTITLTNFQANPLEVVQTISGLRFTVATAGGTLTGSSADQINIAGDGTFTDGGVHATDWILTSSAGDYFLNGLGANGPDQEIIGPPGGGGTYSNANASIAGNGPHNPFLNQTATFTLTIPGLPANAVISNVIFQFGTGTDSVPGTVVPEPASMLLLGTGLLGFGAAIRYRRKATK
jgi:hypothetical protein